MNFIGDLAGNYHTLLALLRKMPDEETWSLGDMIDRGPRSKECLEHFMKHGKALLGNHEHLMLNHMRKGTFYDEGLWFENGGRRTTWSFGGDSHEPNIPEEILAWLESLPLFYEEPGLLVTHAPKHPRLALADINNIGEGFCGWKVDHASDKSVIWNRVLPQKIEGTLQLFGHNAGKGALYFTEQCQQGSCSPVDNPFAICLDGSRGGKLVGINWPSLEVFEQEYID